MSVAPDFSKAEVEAGRLLFAGEWSFLSAAGSVASLPQARTLEVAFAGRSNVGKSSLINALTGRHSLARTSNTPGRTQELIFFGGPHRVMLVDLPGYGYAAAAKSKVAAWTKLIHAYLNGRATLGRVYVLVDARHGLKAADVTIFDTLGRAAVSYEIVLTKCVGTFAGTRSPLKGNGLRPSERTFMSISAHEIARVLSEALPYMQRYDEETIVIKYGGHAMGDEHLAREFARDVVLLEQTAINPIVVHGGGPQIEAMLKKVGVQSQYAAGLRITDEKTLEIVEMVLAGSINKQMVGYINAAGGKAVGLCGKDGNMVIARKLTRAVTDPDSHIERIVDLGFVGEPDKVDVTVLNQILGRKLIPVLAPVAAAANGGTFNVNADTFAGAIAGALKAKRLLLLTDVPGVLDKSKQLIKQLSADDARRLIADGTISGGMIPKVETCIDALERGVEGVVILDGKVPHAVLLELFTELGAGTLIHN
jgi:acetylglutamate kinase